MQSRQLGRTGLSVSPVGFGAFKIGRNQGIKYPSGYDLPSEQDVSILLNRVLDAGIRYIDTAPAYGLSEKRIGKAIGHRRAEFTLSTKVGETFENGRSTYDFSAKAIRESVQRSLKRLQTDILDAVFLHSDGNDLKILNETEAVSTLVSLKEQGLIRAVGLSGKTIEGARSALEWADVLMVEYHLEDISHSELLSEAHKAGIGIVVKKGLAAGRIAPHEAIPFVLKNPAVTSLVIGGLNINHLRENIAIAERSLMCRTRPATTLTAKHP
ncbi:MAG: aldo/keto reductase [Planctomycetaceae bacterium]